MREIGRPGQACLVDRPAYGNPDVAARRVFLVYDGVFSPVFDSQVMALLCRMQEEGVVHDLVVFSSYRTLPCNGRYREKINQIRDRLQGKCFFYRTMPYLGMASMLFPVIRLRVAMRKLGIRPEDSVTIHARGHQATYMALSLKRSYPNLRVIGNLRGAAAPEVSNYKEKGNRLDIVLTRRAQAISLERMEDMAVKESDSLICVSNAFKEYLMSTHRASGEGIHVIGTCVNTDRFKFSQKAREAARLSLGFDGKLVLAYCGSAHKWELPDQVFRTFKSVADLCPDARLLVLTTQPKDFEQVLASSGVPSELVTITSVPHQQVPDCLMAADVGLLIRGDDLVNRVAAPTKFAEYLACGLPVVVSRGVGDTESVVRTYGVGYVIEGLSDESISEVAQQIVNDRDRLNSEQSKLRCAQVAENLHSWSSQLEALLGAYRHAEQPDAK